jgi:hypothetical protein
MRSKISILFCAALTLAACNSDAPADSYANKIETDSYLPDASFEDVGDTTQCTEDCSGHEAGFEWARENGLTDPSECSGKSASFIEGCEAYTTGLEDDSAVDVDGQQ